MHESVPESEDTISTLEKAKRRLYAQTPVPAEKRVFSSTNTPSSLPHAWKEEETISSTMYKKRRTNFPLIFFGVSAFFFLIAAGTAAYIFYFGGGSVSTRNIDVVMGGPTSIAAGDTVTLSLSITNRNPAELRDAKLDITFPPGTRSAEDVLVDYPRYAETLGTLSPGQTVTRTVRAVFYGTEGDALSTSVEVAFGTENASATFAKRESFSVNIGSSPLSIIVAAPKEAVSGQPFPMTFSVRSNAQSSIGQVAVFMSKPLGFTLASSSVPYVNDGFFLGTVKPGETRTIRLMVALSGPADAKRAFNVSVGTLKNEDDIALAVTYASNVAELSLASPFITTTLALNGSTQEPFVLAPGSKVSGTVSYANMLPVAITNAEITVAIAGGAIDYETVETQRGFYRSSDQSIVFGRDTNASLSSLESGATGIVSFSFQTLPGASIRDSSAVFTISVSGVRAGQYGVPERVATSKVVTAKVRSGAVLTARSLHDSGPFANTGPIPPISGTPTSYTILWRVENAGNALADTIVSAALPSYVSFTGEASSNAITYNEGTRTVTWRAGDIAAGQSVEGAFQVSFSPSASQAGSVPVLIGSASLTSYDRFAGTTLSLAAGAVTTETLGDSNRSPDGARVR